MVRQGEAIIQPVRLLLLEEMFFEFVSSPGGRGVIEILCGSARRCQYFSTSGGNLVPLGEERQPASYHMFNDDYGNPFPNFTVKTAYFCELLLQERECARSERVGNGKEIAIV
jgi:hypothetical protein